MEKEEGPGRRCSRGGGFGWGSVGGRGSAIRWKEAWWGVAGRGEIGAEKVGAIRDVFGGGPNRVDG